MKTDQKNQQIDYKKLGFRCGLEIHQQLSTRKLFCNCPSTNTDKKPDIFATRKLRAVVGEMGQIDIAAMHEMGRGKTFSYESHSSDTCLVEYDEEPPRNVNQEALDIALRVALLLDARIVDEANFMRKLVIDGSNATGFQRTGLVALGGKIATSEGSVEIATICLEEESAQRLGEEGDTVKYKLDRLGIPLIEIATSASIRSAEHAKEVATHIGMVLRSVEGVKRGIGTIRQDVNISIEKGARTEIKGFQDLRSIPRVIEFEVGRQQELIADGKKINKEVRKAEPDFSTTFLRPIPGAARMYPETDVLPVRISQEHISRLNKTLPVLLSERVKQYEREYILPHDLAKEAIEANSFEPFMKKFKNITPLTIAQALIGIPKDIKKRLNLDVSLLTEKDFEDVLSHVNSGKVPKDAILDLLVKKIKKERINWDEFSGISDEELEKEIKKIVSEKIGLSPAGYMGLVMAKFRGKVEGKKAMEMIREMVGNA